MITSTWTATRTKGACIKKFATTRHTFSYKRNLNANLGNMVLWDASPLSSQSTDFQDKVSIPCPKSSSLGLLACCAVSSTNLDSVTVAWREYQETGISGNPFHHEWTFI